MTTNTPLIKQMIDNVCRLAMTIPLEEAQAVSAEIDRTETLMPLLDPSAYMKIMDNIPAHRDVVQAFVTFRIALAKVEKKETST